MKYFKLILLVAFVFVLAVSFTKNTSDEPQELIGVHTLSEFKTYLGKDGVRVKLASGNYQIDDAQKIRFIEFTGNNTHFDLSGMRFMVVTKLFSRDDMELSNDGNSLYCAIEIYKKNVNLEGLYIENYGDKPGKQSKNKMFNVVGEDVTSNNIEVRTAG